jgi:hypothetical protein
MQELMVYAGHSDNYAKSADIIAKFTSIKVCPSQVYRVTNHVSTSMSSEDNKYERTLKPLFNDDYLYCELDGSMICTRNEDSTWKEVKLGRLFLCSDCLNPNSDAPYIQYSQYVAHFGTSTDFCEKVDGILDCYGNLKDRLVFINDGASWIRDWILDNYPLAYSILDFYHAAEYLYNFANKTFSDANYKKQWCEEQLELMKSSDIEKVLENIALTNAKDDDKKTITCYYQRNKGRMLYKDYRKIGCCIIGSGAIESAHRTVIQDRMKQSGQRWTRKGAENMLRLRVISMNKQWTKVIDLLKAPQLAKSA